MNVLILEPYMTDSHRAWAEGVKRHSTHEVEILGLPGVQWKWRMHGAAVYFADLLKTKKPVDLLIVSEMLDLATFKGLLPKAWAQVPSILYFHENQLTYPWSANDSDPDTGRDLHYAWIHMTGCMAADAVWFNSAYHKQVFLTAAEKFVVKLPGHLPDGIVDSIRSKSRVMPIGIDRHSLPAGLDRSNTTAHIILWNHRWEYDKGPETFFAALYELQDAGIDFHLVVLGKGKKGSENVFEEAKRRLSHRILHWGYVESKEAYYDWLERSTILPVTSRHDFFGLSVLEAIAAGVQPLLPERLSYPEIFGKDEGSFYQKEEELIEKLKNMISNPWKENEVLKEAAEQFVWEKIIRQYDASISKIV